MSDDFCFYQVCLVLPFSRMSFDALNLEILPDMFIQAQYLFNHFLHTILELKYAKKLSSNSYLETTSNIAIIVNVSSLRFAYFNLKT